MRMPKKTAFTFTVNLEVDIIAELRVRKVDLNYSPVKDVIAHGAASVAQIQDALMLPFRVDIRALDLVEGLLHDRCARRAFFMHWPRRNCSWGFKGITASELVNAVCRLWLLTGHPDPIPWVEAHVAELKKNRRRVLTKHDLSALWWKDENRSFKSRANVILHGAEPCDPSITVLRGGRVAMRATNDKGEVRELIGPANLMKGRSFRNRLWDNGFLEERPLMAIAKECQP